LSRRSFLHATAGLLALPALAAPEKNLTLGFSLYGMKSDRGYRRSRPPGRQAVVSTEADPTGGNVAAGPCIIA
ncbi:MAG: hypothetical protein VCC99_17795, partial [Alphaproteobacteria bacterium]